MLLRRGNHQLQSRGYLAGRFGKPKQSALALFTMCLPALALLIAFNYVPMVWLTMAFKRYRANLGLFGSEWVGLDNFKFFFTSQDAWRVTRNTIGLNAVFILLVLLFSLTFAVLLNRVVKKAWLKFFQTVFFFPYFLSWIVVAYMLFGFLNMDHGIINSTLERIGAAGVKWYTKAEYWPYILTLAYVWKNAGYFSIIYFAAILGIDQHYYEAASLDGATKWQMITRITIPLISPVIITVLLLQVGKIFFADFGLFYFLPRQIGILFSTTDVIDTYVYRALRVTGETGLASAAGLYQSVVGLLLVIGANAVVRRIDPDSALF